MFCLLPKFHMPRPFCLTAARILKLPDAKLNVSLKNEYRYAVKLNILMLL